MEAFSDILFSVFIVNFYLLIVNNIYGKIGLFLLGFTFVFNVYTTFSQAITINGQVEFFPSIVNAQLTEPDTPRFSTVTLTPKGESHESWSFQFPDYYTDIQEGNLIDIRVICDYPKGIGKDESWEYPDVSPAYDFIANFLKNYPNKNAYWEVINKDLTQALLTEKMTTSWGMTYVLGDFVDGITVDIDVHPGKIPISRSSTVGATSLGDFHEAWSFAFEDYYTEIQGGNVLDINVSYDYVSEIGKNEELAYPEFTQVYDFIDNFLKEYPNKKEYWEVVTKNLTETLLTQAIPTEFGFDYDLAKVVDSLTVEIYIEPK